MTHEQYKTLAGEVETFARQIRHIQSGVGAPAEGGNLSGERTSRPDYPGNPEAKRSHRQNREEIHMDHMHTGGDAVSGGKNFRSGKADPLVYKVKWQQFIEDNIVVILGFSCVFFLAFRAGMVLGKIF